MNETAAANLVKTTFENPYSREHFLIFAKNIFKSFDENKAFHARGHVKEKFKKTAPVIKTYERFGTFTDKDNNKIDILAVYLEKDNSLDRARTAQRNFVADYLKQRDAKEAALVAFIPPTLDNWRLSLVKMDYSLTKSKAGKIKAITELTPARRFSFSVGKDENTHTAQKQLLPILQIDDHPPKLTDLEDAFSVEVVTKDFFEKYKTLFLNTKEALDKIIAKDAKIKSDFTKKNIDTVDFTKKLLGQIVFLYFLQKKGWFGVSKDEDWGMGPKDFLRRLFEKKLSDYDNFFNDILEPLFYEALAFERSDDFYSKFNCKIPFLNGGLFDPLGNYDWIHTDIRLNDSLFSNERKTKEGDIGDGILDVFDRYNFTVKEDEPLEKEVAIDPEMLGKSYEKFNAIRSDNFEEYKKALKSGKRSEESKFNKQYGVYYTPREIVHYMCQESLINYLVSELGRNVKRDEIETLIRLGETAIEHDSRVVSRGEETATYKFKLPKNIRDNSSLIDKKLKKIKVCDPAVGSGAFLVGMMTEVIRIRNTLSSYLPKNNRSIYAFKRQAIKDCLYGVDIDLGAVEICKLRLWLSLIVDEESREIVQPLPNLDYKVMQGNSLIELVSYTATTDEKRNVLVNRLKGLKDELFSITSPEAKKKKREEIDNLIKQLFEYDKNKGVQELEQKIWAIKSQGRLFETKQDRKEDEKKINKYASKIKEVNSLKIPGLAEHFEWNIIFSEVFVTKDGFDIVIANPPYINAIEMKKNFHPNIRDNFKKTYASAKGAYDIYLLFFERGFKLLRHKGCLAFITPNKYLSANYAAGFRSYVINNHHLKKITDVSQVKVFAEVSIYPVISFFIKGTLDKYRIETIKLRNQSVSDLATGELEVLVNDSDHLTLLPENIWGFLLSNHFNLVKKIYEQSTPLSKVVEISASSTASEADEYSNLLSENAKSYSKKLVNTGTIDPFRSLWGIDKLTNKGKKYLKPYLELDSSVVSAQRRVLYNKPKIIVAKIGLRLEAFLDEAGEFSSINTNCLFSPEEDYPLKYIAAFIHSNLFQFIFSQFFGSLRMGGGYYQFQAPQLRVMPITRAENQKIRKIEFAVNKILQLVKIPPNETNQSKFEYYRNQIDQIVYKLYRLTDEEKEIVEKNIK